MAEFESNARSLADQLFDHSRRLSAMEFVPRPDQGGLPMADVRVPERLALDLQDGGAMILELLDMRREHNAPVTSLEIARLNHDANVSEVSERLRFQHEYSLAGIRGLFIANGGAVIALFTFMGNTQANFDHQFLWWSFLAFGSGIAAALAAYFGAYLSQAQFMYVTAHQMWNFQRIMVGTDQTEDHEKPLKWGNRALNSAIGAAVASLTGFVVGSGFALSAVLN